MNSKFGMVTPENKEELHQTAGFLFFQRRSTSKKKKNVGRVFGWGRWADVAISESKMLTRVSLEGRAVPEHWSIFVLA